VPGLARDESAEGGQRGRLLTSGEKLARLLKSIGLGGPLDGGFDRELELWPRRGGRGSAASRRGV
jgi:hypothetical protein